MCPPQGKRAKNADDYVEAEYLGVLATDPKNTYDAHLHYAIAHMRRADGALPPHEATGRKTLDFLAGKRQPRCDLLCARPL